MPRRRKRQQKEYAINSEPSPIDYDNPRHAPRTAETRALLRLFANILPGNTLTYRVIREETGLSFPNPFKQYLIQSTLKRLAAEGYIYMNVRGKGYRRLTDSEIIDKYLPHQRTRVSKIAHKTSVAIGTVRTDMLEPPQRHDSITSNLAWDTLQKVVQSNDNLHLLGAWRLDSITRSKSLTSGESNPTSLGRDESVNQMFPLPISSQGVTHIEEVRSRTRRKGRAPGNLKSAKG